MAAGDLNGDGAAELVVGAGPGGASHIRVFDGATGAEGVSFFAFAPGFQGGVNVAVSSIAPEPGTRALLLPVLSLLTQDAAIPPGTRFAGGTSPGVSLPQFL